MLRNSSLKIVIIVILQFNLFVSTGTIRATVMVETLLAGVNMEEMLYEIREHCCGMNAGRWDYIFSAIKRFSRKPDCVLPDRKQVYLEWLKFKLCLTINGTFHVISYFVVDHNNNIDRNISLWPDVN